MQQAFGTEWLRHEIGRAKRHCAVTLRVVTRRGEDDARQLARAFVRPHAREHLESRDVRHHQVEPDHLQVHFAIQRLERLDAVIRERDPEWALLELHLDDAANVRLIIDHQDVRSFN